MTTPRRHQFRRRVKGWHKPEGAVMVCRPHKWGNPFPAKVYGLDECLRLHRDDILADPGKVAAVRRDIRGRDVVCYCPLDEPCHGVTLLKIANGEDW